jgi:hypothetical protein
MSYKGKFTPQNPEKYVGDITSIRWLSLWERGVMHWLDKNEYIKRWGSEIIKVKYICETDNRSHLYLVDFFIEYTNGKKLLVEVKPSGQTQPPKQPAQINNNTAAKPKTGQRQRAKYLKEAKTYIKNVSKWKAASNFAKKNNMTFEIWTEHFLRTNLGIRVI